MVFLRWASIGEEGMASGLQLLVIWESQINSDWFKVQNGHESREREGEI